MLDCVGDRYDAFLSAWQAHAVPNARKIMTMRQCETIEEINECIKSGISCKCNDAVSKSLRDNARSKLNEAKTPEDTIEFIANIFKTVGLVDGADDLIEDACESIDPASIGARIREANAADREHGREIDSAYLSLVYLVLSSRFEGYSRMAKPKSFEEMCNRTGIVAAS